MNKLPALLNYIYSSFSNNQHKKAFISNPPGPAILLLSNDRVFPGLSGITVVKERQINNLNSNQQISSGLISTIVNDIRNNSPIPSLSIEYDFADSDDSNHSLYIDGQQYNVTDGGNFIASAFNLQIGPEVPKAINSTEAVTDPFHLWSSDLFSGTTVKKIDLDLVIISTSNNTISTLVEVKRSARRSFNAWQPFPADYNNYVMMFSLSDALDIPFITIHHNEMEKSKIDPGKTVNVYSYNPNSSMDWQSFRSFSNRQQISAKQAVSQL